MTQVDTAHCLNKIPSAHNFQNQRTSRRGHGCGNHNHEFSYTKYDI